MTPYSNLLFFYILIILLIPAIILGILGKKIKTYGIIITLLMMIIIFRDLGVESSSLILFYLGELILIKLYMVIRKKSDNKWILRFVVLISIIPLILTKQGTFGFLGISYLTFKVVQVLIEIHDGLIKKIKFLDFTYFLLFFPTISSGPIDRSRRFESDINKVLTKEEYINYLQKGINKLFLGLAYKFIIGNFISEYWMNTIPSTHRFVETLNYMYAYSFYLFFDFAGYSLIAIGVSYILGVKTPDNFNMPFISKDIKDFWNRWHMSLSFWFRDFIYTRFVMASMKSKRFKSRYTSSYLGYIVTMGTMGIWHGTEKYYILYGFYHGILIVLTDYFQRKSKFYKKYHKKNIFKLVSTIVTFHLVCLGFLIFSGKLVIK